MSSAPTKPSRLSLLYLLTVLVAAAVIAAVLHWGAALPSSAGSIKVAAPGVIPGHLGSWEGWSTNLAHPLSRLFVQLLVILVASRAMGAIFSRAGQPGVVGEMAAGIVLGPSLFGLLAPDALAFVFPRDSLNLLGLLSQVGVCLFMFTVGMELNVGQLRSRARAAVAVSHASILMPYVLGVILAYFLFQDLAAPGATFTAFALFMGISMSITAFPVLARMLQERGLSGTALGNMAITCAATDDVTAWSLLAVVVAIARAASLDSVVLILMCVAAFVAAMVLGVRRVLPRWLGDARLARAETSRGTLTIVTCLVLAAALTTEVIGIHALFGAFLAGTIIPDTHDFRNKVRVRIEPFSSVLLLPLFFAFTGLRTQVGLLDDLNGWLLCFAIIAIATFGKLGGSAVAARLTGMGWGESLQLGALMNTRGLMELIALNVGYDLGILSPRIFTMLVIMALATTMLTGPLLTLFGRRLTLSADLREPSRL